MSLFNIAQKYLDKLSQIKANEPNLIIQANADRTNLEVGDIFTIIFKSTSKALITIKNNNAVIDSFVLPQSDSRSYKVDKAGGEELIEIIGVTAKGKQDTTQLRITTKEKWTPTPTPTQTLIPRVTPIQTPIKESPGFNTILTIIPIIALQLILKILRKY